MSRVKIHQTLPLLSLKDSRVLLELIVDTFMQFTNLLSASTNFEISVKVSRVDQCVISNKNLKILLCSKIQNLKRLNCSFSKSIFLVKLLFIQTVNLFCNL